MATTQALLNVNLPAAISLAAKQYYLIKVVRVGTTANADLSGDGNSAIGVLQNAPLLGEPATIAVAGIAKVSAGGNIQAGQNVASDANGQGVVATTGENIIGIALEDASANNIFRVILGKNGLAA